MPSVYCEYTKGERQGGIRMTVKKYTELKRLLDQQDILKVPKEIYQYAKAQRTLFDVVCDVFNYGYILGIRAERARRKGGKA